MSTSTMTEKPIDVVLFVADVCQLKCKYCYNKFPRTAKLADLDKMLAFVKKLAAARAIDDLVVVGGEPTLHPQLPSFIQQLLGIGAQSVVLWTNFEMDLEQYYIPLLDQGCNIAMSWHGKDDDKRNLKFIKKALQLPDRYIEHGQVVELDLMAEQDNFDNFKMAYRMLHPKYGQYTYTWPVYTSELVIGEYSQSQLKTLQQMATELKRSVFQISGASGQLKMETPLYNYQGWHCKAGRDYVYVHCTGDVYNCQSYYQFGMKPMFNINAVESLDLSSALRPCTCQVKSCRFADYQVEREKPNACFAVKD